MRGKVKFSAAGISHRSALLNVEFWNFDCDSGAGGSMLDLRPARNFRWLSFRQLHKIILNVSLGHLDQLYRSRQAAVVPPVGVRAGNAVGMSCVVYFDDDAVVAVLEL